MKTENWIVRVKCTVIKEVNVSNATRELVERDLWERATDECEIMMTDWEIINIKPEYAMDARKQV